MNKVIIMRGAPGSGKSHWVAGSNTCSQAIVMSTDHYFETPDGYVFDPAKLAEHHDTCLRRFVGALHRTHTDIVIDNTNTKLFEIAPYYRLGEAFGREVEVVWIVAPLETCVARNRHGVPAETIKAMIQGVEPLPPWWNVQIVVG